MPHLQLDDLGCRKRQINEAMRIDDIRTISLCEGWPLRCHLGLVVMVRRWDQPLNEFGTSGGAMEERTRVLGWIVTHFKLRRSGEP